MKVSSSRLPRLIRTRKLTSRLRHQEQPTKSPKRVHKLLHLANSRSLIHSLLTLGRRLRTNSAPEASTLSSRTHLPSRTPWRCSCSTMQTRTSRRSKLRTLTRTTLLRPRLPHSPWPWASRETMEPPLLTTNQARSQSFRTWTLTAQRCCPKSQVDTPFDTISSRRWLQVTNSSTWSLGMPIKSSIIWKPSRRGLRLKRITKHSVVFQRFSYLAKQVMFCLPTVSHQWLINV